jgi:hypothetical protein
MKLEGQLIEKNKPQEPKKTASSSISGAHSQKEEGFISTTFGRLAKSLQDSKASSSQR